ncbi:NUDIX hydrolase [Sphingosinithalassobacter portus]|uniref:NUDIX hydrolase n=1 Tax=Stakelama portus TaxID=2676234 RepID=UPI001EFE1278|nr:NUDIX hydrolase [Sphingosinithalassobacter portus]
MQNFVYPRLALNPRVAGESMNIHMLYGEPYCTAGNCAGTPFRTAILCAAKLFYVSAMNPRITDSRLVYDGWYKLFRLEIAMDEGVTVERHLLDNGSAVAVLPYDPVRRTVMLISQPRAAVLAAGHEPLFEAIAGNLDRAAPAERICEEALEEAGLTLGALEPVANIWPIPPVSTERVQLYLASYDTDSIVGPGGGAPDEHEFISVHEIDLDALKGLVEAGDLPDAKTLVLAQALMLRHPELRR